MRPWAAMRRKGFCIDILWRYFGFRAMFCDRLKSEEVTPGACNTHPNVLCCKLEQATLQPTTYTRDRTEGHVFPGVRLNRNRRKLNSVASSIQIMDGMGKSIPLARAPHDQIRFGFSSFAQDASNGHPLEAINKSRVANEFDFKMDTARKVYGSAFVMRMKTEVAALSQAQRLPGLPSSMLGLETVLGRDETLEFEDYFDLPAERPVAPRFEVHHAMEVQYGLL